MKSGHANTLSDVTNVGRRVGFREMVAFLFRDHLYVPPCLAISFHFARCATTSNRAGLNGGRDRQVAQHEAKRGFLAPDWCLSAGWADGVGLGSLASMSMDCGSFLYGLGSFLWVWVEAILSILYVSTRYIWSDTAANTLWIGRSLGCSPWCAITVR